ncbi:hypothetical protein [Shewanella woodyi]|uniref:hypothetical protein n=1 Tax=Shewanella woodyi TaxID=60961 RepID=UPI0007E95CCF|nr:hypothetical protein [Shewanella woodyi]
MLNKLLTVSKVKLELKWITLLMATLFSTGVYATSCVQNNNIVTFTGLDSKEGVIYASLSSHDNQCGCSYIRFAPQNTRTEMALSILMAAKLSQNRVRIDLMEHGNCNTAYRVYLQ